MRRCAGPDRSPVFSASALIDAPIFRGFPKRDLGNYQGAGARAARDPEVSAEQGHPLAHTRETDPFSGTGGLSRLVRRETYPVVPHGKPDRLAGATRVPLNREVYPLRVRMLADVVQRFLGDPEERRLDGDR